MDGETIACYLALLISRFVLYAYSLLALGPWFLVIMSKLLGTRYQLLKTLSILSNFQLSHFFS